MKISYDGNDQETYYLLFNDIVMAELFVGEDGAINIVDDVKKIVTNQMFHEVDMCVSATTTDDNKELVIQVTDQDQDDILFTQTLKFEDYRY